MRAVDEDREFYIVSPKTKKYVGRLRARDVFSLITQNAWKTGDPGLIFIDEINRKHPAKHLGDIETTNQCGEAPLLPYEGCVFEKEPLLGSKGQIIRQLEKAHLVNLMEAHQGNISQAAKTCGKKRQSLQRLLKKYNLSRQDFSNKTKSSIFLDPSK